ncbi:adenylate/guanylate cyclase domain-containing protein [Reyranella soli]|uniref:Guanylyl cyclase n=1 Tax=Reyranella soli TaxID=1230389 RepID=A0A512NGA2_9HYPH|nr:tetratricopeptide repeat protein [Reyranella soli]GEP57971.1 guanylyl cyclase [Reyranella soli]
MAELDLSEFRSEHHASWARRAILLVDIAGAVRLVERDEGGVTAHWLDFVDHVKKHIVPSHNGHLVKGLGDSILLDFADVRSGASAALAIQQECHRANSARAADRQIMLRIGMEVIDVIVGANDGLGRGVDVATRLVGLARPGEIVVSQHVHDGLTADLDADIEDLGDCPVRGFPDLVRAYRVGPPGPQLTVDVASFDELAPSIAVVPFASRSAAADQGVIGEILAEEVIRRLSQSADLKVVSRLSTTAFSGRAASLREIRAHLGADYVLSGAYRAGGTRLKLDVELAEAKTGRVLWSESLYDDLAGIVSGEQELIGRLIAAVGAAVTAREVLRSRTQPLPTLKAYTLMMGAVSLMHRLSLPDFEESHRLLQALIDRGVRHPLPIAWLGNWHVLRVQQGWSDDPQRDTYLASECAKRALDMDPDNSLALAIDGFVHVNLLKKFDVAQKSYERALVANPSNALAWLLKSTLHAFKSEGEQAIDHAERALSLSPLDPHRYFYESLAAIAAVAAGRYRRALELAQRSLHANRKHTSTWRSLTVAQWQLGRFDDARQSAQELLKFQPL